MTKANSITEITIYYPERPGFIILSHEILRGLVELFAVHGNIESQPHDIFLITAEVGTIYKTQCRKPTEIDIGKIFSEFCNLKPPLKSIDSIDLRIENLLRPKTDDEWSDCFCSGE